jgi:hypothetical protein
LRIVLPGGLAYWTVLDDGYRVLAAPDAFLRDLRFGADRTESTTKLYASELALFLDWAARSGRDLERAARELSRFVVMLRTTTITRRGRGFGEVRSAGRINHVLAALDSDPGRRLVSARGVAMHSQRRLDSQLKRERVTATVDALLAAGGEVTIAAVARHARVSRKFIYSHPDLRAELELRALRATHAASATTTASARVTGASLRADAENYKAQSHRLRQQLKTLEQRLAEILGTQLAETLPNDERIDHTSHDELRRQLEGSEAHAFELEQTLAEARQELEAVREINRELLSRHNRAAG